MSTSAARANHLALVSTTSTSKPPFLHRRDGLCYFKRKIPRDCRDLFGGKRQVWKSLGTDQLEKAKVMLAVEVTEFDLTVARYRRERAACAAGVIPLSRPRTRASIVAAPQPGGEATPASLAHLDVLRSVEAAFEQLRVLMAPQIALAPAVVPMPVPERPRAPTNPQSSTSSPQRGRIQPTMLHLLEDWKRKQNRQYPYAFSSGLHKDWRGREKVLGRGANSDLQEVGDSALRYLRPRRTSGLRQGR